MDELKHTATGKPRHVKTKEERIAEVDEKIEKKKATIEKLKAEIKDLEKQKKDLENPINMRDVNAKIKESGMTPQEIVEKLGLKM